MGKLANQFPKFAALPFVAIDDDVIAGAPVRCINIERALRSSALQNVC